MGLFKSVGKLFKGAVKGLGQLGKSAVKVAGKVAGGGFRIALPSVLGVATGGIAPMAMGGVVGKIFGGEGSGPKISLDSVGKAIKDKVEGAIGSVRTFAEKLSGTAKDVTESAGEKIREVGQGIADAVLGTAAKLTGRYFEKVVIYR